MYELYSIFLTAKAEGHFPPAPIFRFGQKKHSVNNLLIIVTNAWRSFRTLLRHDATSSWRDAPVACEPRMTSGDVHTFSLGNSRSYFCIEAEELWPRFIFLHHSSSDWITSLIELIPFVNCSLPFFLVGRRLHVFFLISTKKACSKNDHHVNVRKTKRDAEATAKSMHQRASSRWARCVAIGEAGLDYCRARDWQPIFVLTPS